LFLLPSIFVDVGVNLIMADDVATPSNPPVAPIDKEELEEAPLNEVTLEVNVSQWSCEENHPEEWCAFESIVRHGIVNCLLTHMP
jgi:hypothetical protein